MCTEFEDERIFGLFPNRAAGQDKASRCLASFRQGLLDTKTQRRSGPYQFSRSATDLRIMPPVNHAS